MFTPVPPHPNLLQLEESILRYWRTHRTHEKAVAARLEGPAFVFSRQPPSANRSSGLQEALNLAHQDLFLRYKAMRGYNVARQASWQAHGMGVEIEAERRLHLSLQAPLVGSELEAFVAACRQIASQRLEAWEGLAWRMGFWRQLAGAAATCDDEYIQSLWWGLKAFWEKGWLAPSVQVLPYCPRCATPVDARQLAYRRAGIENLAAYVHLPLADEAGTSLLVWSDAAWKLPGAVAVAAHPDEEYLVVERILAEGGVQRILLAASRLEAAFPKEALRVVERFKGRKLRARRYLPLYTFLPLDKPAHYVVLSDAVRVDCGSGLAPLAPAFSQAHLRAAQEFDLPVLPVLTEQGAFIPEVRPWSGKPAREAAPLILGDLQARGLLERREALPGSLPLCPECKTPVVHLPRSAWFLRTAEMRQALATHDEAVTWYPSPAQAHSAACKGDNAEDRLIGVERYWGAPLPVWECQTCHHQLCVGSLAELSQLAGEALPGSSLHRPEIDRVRLPCPQCRGQMLRVPEVVAAWFEEGALPFAGWGYPWVAQEEFQANFPADLVCEAESERCGWLNDVQMTSGSLFSRSAFHNAVRLGSVRTASGDEAQLLGEAFTSCGSDALRVYVYAHSAPGKTLRFSLEELTQAQRAWLPPLWGAYRYFVGCANRRGWQPGQNLGCETGAHDRIHILDRWLLSELQVLTRDVTTALEIHDARGAIAALHNFVDRLSRWYLRLSRQRLAGEDAAEAESALAALYTALCTLSRLLAPIAPLLAEELYHSLVGAVDEAARETVHAADWPLIAADLIDEPLNGEIRRVRELAALGRRCRHLAGFRLRQPLAEMAFWVWAPEERHALERHAGLLAQELNLRAARLLDVPREAAAFQLIPDLRLLGQEHGGRLPGVLAALAELDVQGASRALLAGHALHLAVAGKAVTLSPRQVAVSIHPVEGFVVARQGERLAALPVELSPEARAIGLARDFVRQVQSLRKRAGLEAGDAVRLYVQATPGLRRALDAHRDIILTRLQVERWVKAEAPPGAPRAIVKLGKEFLEVGLVR
ncbi:MAG: class I tRNA ligase family protein [Anaerolineales bacterium]|nr:class I tRNA ligase family protein [Anaerolineales bacterium]